MSTLVNKVTSSAMAAVLAVGLCPAFALAVEPEPDSSATPSEQVSDAASTEQSLVPVNAEKMFKAETASLVTGETGSYLKMSMSGTGYEKMFVGTLAEYNSRADDTGIVEYSLNADNKYEFMLPITLNADESETVVPLLAFSKSDGLPTVRQAVLNIAEGTMTLGNSDRQTLVMVNASALPVNPEGTVRVYGYPYAKESGGNYTSNNYSVTATFSFADGAATIDKARVLTQMWNSDKAAYDDELVLSDEYAVNADDGTLALTIENLYRQSSQINGGQTAQVQLHVADGAPFEEAGTWVSATVIMQTQLTMVDATLDTPNTLSIEDVALTPLSKEQSIAAKKVYKVAYKKVQKKAQTVDVAFASTSGSKVTYKAAKTAGGKVQLAKNGAVTVKKGTAKGTYTLKVTATAKAKGVYAKTTVKNVPLKVKVK